MVHNSNNSVISVCHCHVHGHSIFNYCALASPDVKNVLQGMDASKFEIHSSSTSCCKMWFTQKNEWNYVLTPIGTSRSSEFHSPTSFISISPTVFICLFFSYYRDKVKEEWLWRLSYSGEFSRELQNISGKRGYSMKRQTKFLRFEKFYSIHCWFAWILKLLRLREQTNRISLPSYSVVLVIKLPQCLMRVFGVGERLKKTLFPLLKHLHGAEW